MGRTATDTWVPVIDDAVQSLDQTDPGMSDVHSSSIRRGATDSLITPGELKNGPAV